MVKLFRKLLEKICGEKRRMPNQKGLALITVIFVFLIVALAVGATIILAGTERSTSKNSERAEQALAFAEAGIDWAAAKLRSNTDFTTSTTYVSVSQTGSVGVSVVQDQGSETATAYVVSFSRIPALDADTPTAARSIRVIFRVEKSILNISGLFERAVTTDGFLLAKNNATITISSNLPHGDGVSLLSNYASSIPPAVSFGSGLVLDGNVGLMDGATYSGLDPSQVTRTEPDPVRTLTSTELAFWQDKAIQQGHYYEGNQNWGSGVTLDGVYYIKGNLEIDNKLNGIGTLVVEGNLWTKNKTTISSSSMAIIVTGTADIDMKNGASITGYIYCGGNIEFKNSLTLVGAIVAKGNVEFKNNMNITYQDLSQSPDLPPGWSRTDVNLPLISWLEVPPP